MLAVAAAVAGLSFFPEKLDWIFKRRRTHACTRPFGGRRHKKQADRARQGFSFFCRLGFLFGAQGQTLTATRLAIAPSMQ